MLCASQALDCSQLGSAASDSDALVFVKDQLSKDPTQVDEE